MTDRPSDPSARLDALEAHVAHQERLIAELNDVVTAQWRKIDALERRLAKLREEAENFGPPQHGVIDPPPPHY